MHFTYKENACYLTNLHQSVKPCNPSIHCNLLNYFNYSMFPVVCGNEHSQRKTNRSLEESKRVAQAHLEIAYSHIKNESTKLRYFIQHDKYPNRRRPFPPIFAYIRFFTMKGTPNALSHIIFHILSNLAGP